MSRYTKIDWCDTIWNPCVGCTKVSEGCKNCYAETIHSIRHKAYLEGKLKNHIQYAKPFNEIQFIWDRLNDPHKWRKKQVVFVNSMGDLFHKDVALFWIAQMFDVMVADEILKCKICSGDKDEPDHEMSETCFKDTTKHQYVILTKRPERLLEFLAYVGSGTYSREYMMRYIEGCEPALDHLIKNRQLLLPDNIWLGVSVEDQKTANERIPELLKIKHPNTFVSVEPMLGEIEFESCWFGGYDSCRGYLPKQLKWVICGGETGKEARPMHPVWIENIKDQCLSAEVPFFFKQWGEWQPGSNVLKGKETKEHRVILKNGQTYPYDKGFNKSEKMPVQEWNENDPQVISRVGKKKAGHLLEGVEYREFPTGIKEIMESKV